MFLHGIKWHILKKLKTPISKLHYHRVLKTDIIDWKYKGTADDVIVSLTTFPARLNTLALCLKSLLLQTIKPYRIIVYLGSDVDEKSLPSSVVKMSSYGIEFKFDASENLKPHKKYFYAMQEYKNKAIITVDDDVVYPPKMIERLINAHKRYPEAICAGRVHRVTFDKDEIEEYSKWLHGDDLTKIPSSTLVPIGIGGVLYPPASINPKAFNMEKIKELCLDADDLWLKCAGLSMHRKVLFVDWASRFLYLIEAAQKESLCSTNVTEKRNDVLLKNAMTYFGINNTDYKD